jgi:hypothetical protein
MKIDYTEVIDELVNTPVGDIFEMDFSPSFGKKETMKFKRIK